MAQANAPPQTPQSQSAPLPPVAHQQVPYAAPASAAGAGAGAATAVTQASPQAKTTPTKSTLKALPTVRDHTTDQLGPGGDEYLPREIDESGEKKVMPNGQLLGGREYRCRTFLVPNRGEKLFMLATECARILNYRDSYLLFNKNRSLFKIIANQVEKDDLVAQEILPFSYRSRQIAIVTARSMFRQFGSRVIVNGRRVRDDYWETKARKQGFTEADLAGEKRPGAAKAREAADAGGHPTALLGAPHGEIVYSNPPGHFAGPQPQIVQPGGMSAAPPPRAPAVLGRDGSHSAVDYHDRRTEYNGIMKGVPRQEMSGQPYTDRTQPTPIAELNAQAHHTAEYNRSVNQNREVRADYLQTQWRRPHEQPASAALAQPTGTSESSIAASSRTAAAPHSGSTGLQQPNMVPNQSPQMLMTGPPYSQPISAQTTLQSSMRGMITWPITRGARAHVRTHAYAHCDFATGGDNIC